MWRGHFQDILNNDSNRTDKQFVDDRINCISAHHITNPGDIDDLKSDKCAGLDNIHAAYLKNASNVLVPKCLTIYIVHDYDEAWLCCKQNRTSDYTDYQEQIRGCH